MEVGVVVPGGAVSLLLWLPCSIRCILGGLGQVRSRGACLSARRGFGWGLGRWLGGWFGVGLEGYYYYYYYLMLGEREPPGILEFRGLAFVSVILGVRWDTIR